MTFMDNLDFLDSIKRRVIVAMFTDDDLMERLVLKGGNALDVVYGLSSRASVDVDLSMDGELEERVLKERILKALNSTFAEAGYVVFDFKFRSVPLMLSNDLKDFWGGYRVQFKLI